MSAPSHPLFEQPWPEGEYRFFQMGFVVDDLAVAAERWTTVHGVGPFYFQGPFEIPMTYRGERTAVNFEIATSQAGPVEIELLKQHCDRPSILRELAVRGSSGFHQVCTVTHDYDGRCAHLAGLGYQLAGEITGGMRIAYFDTFDDFGFYTEIVEHSPGFLDGIGAVAAACASWDGTDPLRVRTDDGYRVY